MKTYVECKYFFACLLFTTKLLIMNKLMISEGGGMRDEG